MTAQVNGVEVPIEPDDTLAELLARRGVPDAGVAVAVSGTVVPRAVWPRTPVCDGDVIEVLTAVQGG